VLKSSDVSCMLSSSLNVEVFEVFLLPGIGVVADAIVKEGTLRRGTYVRVQSTGEVAVVASLEKHYQPIMSAQAGDHVGIRLDFPYKVCNEAFLPTERNFRQLIQVPDSLYCCEKTPEIVLSF
jgi:translation initiation factor IF-2